jgi:hypothetical protein
VRHKAELKFDDENVTIIFLKEDALFLKNNKPKSHMKNTMANNITHVNFAIHNIIY